MSQQKQKKLQSLWYQCEKCEAFILNRDVENHPEICPLKIINGAQNSSFILHEVLYGNLELKSSEEIKNISSREKDGMVFISEAAMQLCNFSIGDFVIIQNNNNNEKKVAPIVQRVWPTNEKSLTSVLVTENCLENSKFPLNNGVTVGKFDENGCSKAKEITLVTLNGPKSLEITPELNNRLSKCYEDCYLTEGNFIHVLYYGKKLKFEIKKISSILNNPELMISENLQPLSLADDYRKFYLVDALSKWKIFKTEPEFHEVNASIKLQNIAGLDKEIEEISELIQITLMMNISSRKSVYQNKSVLLYGNSGTGKTALTKFLCQKFHVNTIEINASLLYSNKSYSSNIEETIRELFDSAIENSPSILILDEIDLLCPSRTSNKLTESKERILATLLTCFDKLSSVEVTAKVFVLSTTNKIDNIDAAFRRCGRLDREIEIPTPNQRNRKLILEKILAEIPQHHQISAQELQELSQITHGYVGADLVALCAAANLEATKRKSEKINLNDFRSGLRKIKPSAMRDVQIEVPNVKWADIGGQNELKLILRKAVEWPLKFSESFTRLGISPHKGVLMFGPPGCSKTMIARALATESGLNFLSIKGPELFSKWVGESEKAVREVFRKARQVAPSIIFFDEIDALGGERSSGSSNSVHERVLAQLLTELDGITPLSDVTILAATNRPDKIDDALLRPGRLDLHVHVPLPDQQTRLEIFRIKFQKIPIQRCVDVAELVEKTRGYSGAEVNAVCNEAAMFALEKNLQSDVVEMEHFEKAVKTIRPRTSTSLLELYERYDQNKI